MFVDASALVAILKREPGFENLAMRLEGAADPITSPVAILEAVMSVSRQKDLLPSDLRARVKETLDAAAIEVLPIDGATADLAIDAHAAYGKGSGHRARLNFGDCFAYAMAKQHGVPLLYKGDDFASTDLA